MVNDSSNNRVESEFLRMGLEYSFKIFIKGILIKGDSMLVIIQFLIGQS